jgi:hypothetical protein
MLHPSSPKQITFLQLSIETKIFLAILLPQVQKQIMASTPQIQGDFLNRLSDDILQIILDLAMERDSPFYVDDPRLSQDRVVHPNGRDRLHDRTLQPVHRTDWITINSINRRMRTLGKVSFFSMKIFAIHDDLPARLQRNDPNSINGMMPHDQALALRYIRDIIIVNPKQASPSTYLALPQILAAFPCLRRCTLLVGSATSNTEWITRAFLLGRPLNTEMHEHLIAIGIPRHFRLEEAMAPGFDWQDQRKWMEKYVYPMLRFKSTLVQAKKQKEISAASQSTI